MTQTKTASKTQKYLLVDGKYTMRTPLGTKTFRPYTADMTKKGIPVAQENILEIDAKLAERLGDRIKPFKEPEKAEKDEQDPQGGKDPKDDKNIVTNPANK